MFSSENPAWATPDDLYEVNDKEFNFDIDVAATKENAKCKKFISPEQNIFETEWTGTAWMNPPYNKPENVCKERCVKKGCTKRGYHISEFVPGQINFVARAKWMAQEGKATTVCLLPARTDTSIFHGMIWDKELNEAQFNVEVRFLEGRVTFKDAPAPAPFPSMIVIFKKWED